MAEALAEEVYLLLYHAKVNVPKACDLLGRTPSEESWEELKEEFHAWCIHQPLLPWEDANHQPVTQNV